MRILIVDDDDNKRLHLLRFVAEQIPAAHLSEARSYQSGLRRLMATEYDLVILDMTMPSYDITAEDDGGRHQAYAGRELLKQMHARGITARVVVVTQYERFGGPDGMTFDELDEELRRDHGDNYVTAIYFDVASPRWRKALGRELSALKVGRA